MVRNWSVPTLVTPGMGSALVLDVVSEVPRANSMMAGMLSSSPLSSLSSVMLFAVFQVA